jgi:hypothetical protein
MGRAISGGADDAVADADTGGARSRRDSFSGARGRAWQKMHATLSFTLWTFVS